MSDPEIVRLRRENEELKREKEKEQHEKEELNFKLTNKSISSTGSIRVNRRSISAKLVANKSIIIYFKKVITKDTIITIFNNKSIVFIYYYKVAYKVIAKYIRLTIIKETLFIENAKRRCVIIINFNRAILQLALKHHQLSAVFGTKSKYRADTVKIHSRKRSLLYN
ncbi:unnamed protein product [Clonostachys solani]|uniref:Uncharacterized protein n=1 Tax=Clonostachys solani TaxID=160281 RepID=A0A9N9ZCX3_9HYPO|nr:unnamed protein product [Clonostachys solani]